MSDDLQAIRDRVDIASLVEEQVSLKRAGRSLKGLCPFHDDRNPSFHVSTETGRYRCWSCGESGDIFTWVMKTRNVTFPEALQMLADRAGVTLTRQKQERNVPSEREQHLAMMREAVTFFRAQLPKAAAAKEYCAKRRLSDEVLAKWEIGFAPDMGDALATQLQRKGFSLAEAKKLFLVSQDPGGGYFDMFRGRLMFPIRDERGDCVGFGGRIMGAGEPKYINSSDSPLFRKSRLLYGLFQSRSALQKNRHLILCEGYLDVIACQEAGIDGAVASLGTSLTEDHAKLIKRWADRVTILYDSDPAGVKAAGRAIEVLKPEQVPVRIAMLPTGEDPDSLLAQGGPAQLRQIVESSVTPLEFGLRSFLASAKPGDARFWEEVASRLAQAPTEMDEDKAIELLQPYFPSTVSYAESRKALKRDIASRRKKTGSQGRKAVVATPITLKGVSAAEAIVLRGLLEEEVQELAWQAVTKFDLWGERVRPIAEQLAAKLGPDGPKGKSSVWLAGEEFENAAQFLDEIVNDPRTANVSAAAIVDSIKALEKERERRSLVYLKSNNPNDEAKAEYMARLSRLQGENS
ncbi:MAG: DNA primase [Armatimonadetes bacterium]|nr:DNA primase [Armatimonadota bacterium]